LCHEYVGEVNFFPGRGESLADAKAVCTRCLVRPECLLYALEHDEPHGVWGGLSVRERHELNASNTGASASRTLEGRGPSVDHAVIDVTSHRG
jgi:hypothetical protein